MRRRWRQLGGLSPYNFCNILSRDKSSYRVERQVLKRFPIVSVACSMRCINRFERLNFLPLKNSLRHNFSLDCSNLGLEQWPDFGEMKSQARYWIKFINMNSTSIHVKNLFVGKC